MSARGSQSPESVVKEIRRNTRRKYTSEEKIRIVLEGLKGEVSIVSRFQKSHRRERGIWDLFSQSPHLPATPIRKVTLLRE
jgi:hypothetical protein